MYKKGHVKRILNEVERYSTPITYLYKNSMVSTSIEFIDDTKNLYVNIYIKNKTNDYIKIYIHEQYPFKPYQIHSLKLLNK